MNQIWQKGVFKIYRVDDGFIVHNSAKEGFAHSHIKNYKTAVYVAEMALNRRLPHDLSRYLLISLMRVSGDEEYTQKVGELLEHKKRKDYYYNANRGARKK